MSRIGKNPVAIPEKVEVNINGAHVNVKGPLGKLEYVFPNEINLVKEAKEILVSVKDDSNKSRSLWGLSRTLLNNMVVGVTVGFKKGLSFTGVGYKAQVNGKKLVLSLGYSHPIEFDAPEGITIKVTNNVIEVSGCDKELVGFVSAKIRSFRSPEPYKGKGIKYVDETIIRKAGKTGAKK